MKAARAAIPFRRLCRWWYEKQHALYEEFCGKLTDLAKDLVDESSIHVSSVGARAKSPASLRDKLQRPEKDYSSIEDLPDLAGLRIVVYLPDDVARLATIIRAEFDIDERQSVDVLDRMSPSEFGYTSIHLVGKLSAHRSILSEWQRFSQLQVEIQVRTVLQDAWAVVSHSLQYKRESQVPRSLQRRLYRVASLLELAEQEFNQVRKEHQNLIVEVGAMSEETLGTQRIDVATMTEFLTRSVIVTTIHNAAAEAGFNAHDAIYPEPLLSACQLAETASIHELSEVLEKANKVKNRFVKLKESHPAEWGCSRDFAVLIILLSESTKIPAEPMYLTFHAALQT